MPTNSLVAPKASSCSTLWYSACPAGQKKNTRMTAICGAISTQGSHADLNRTLFSMPAILVYQRNTLPRLAGEGWGGGAVILSRSAERDGRRQVRQDLLAFWKR